MERITVNLGGRKKDPLCLLGAAADALRNAGRIEESEEMIQKGINEPNPDKVIKIIGRYVEIR